MKITKSKLLEVFKFAGFKTAHTWDNKKIVKKLRQLRHFIDDVDDCDGEIEQTIKAILDAQDNEEKITITVKKSESEDKPEPESEDKPEPESEDKSEPESEDKSEPESEDKSEPKQKRKSGMAIIEDMLKEKSMTRKEIAEVLYEKFPDRDKNHVMKTVIGQVPFKLRDKGYKLSEKIVKGKTKAWKIKQ